MSLKHTENMSVARANMTIEEVKDEFFMKLSDVITDTKLGETDICNVGEPGLILDNRGCTRKIIASKASRTV